MVIEERTMPDHFFFHQTKMLGNFCMQNECMSRQKKKKKDDKALIIVLSHTAIYSTGISSQPALFFFSSEY